MPYYLAT